MLRAISEIADAIRVTSLPVKPISIASCRANWRACTMSGLERTTMRTPDLAGFGGGAPERQGIDARRARECFFRVRVSTATIIAALASLLSDWLPLLGVNSH